MENDLTIKNLLISDFKDYLSDEIIYYPFCRNEAEMIQRIRNHTVSSNFFIFCDCFKRPGKEDVNTERSMDNAINSCGYSSISVDKYFLDEIIDLKKLESSLKKRYGTNYTIHLAERKYRTRPFMLRYILYRHTHDPFKALKTKEQIFSENKKKSICLYYIVYEPLSFLELLGELKVKVGNELTFAMILKDYDYWFGASDLLQPNRRLMKILDPSFIIGPKKYWYSGEHGASFFKNWKKAFATPIIINNELVISHKKELVVEREQVFEMQRELRKVGLIDEL